MAKWSRHSNEIRPDTVKRIVLYGILLLFLSAMQCSFFARLRFWPATPDLMLCAVLGILLLDSDSAAFVSAVVGGWILDAVGGLGVSWSPMIYLLVVAILSPLAKKVIPGLASFLVLLLPSLLLRAAVTVVGVRLTADGLSLSEGLSEIVLPEALMTFLFSILVYALVRLFRIPLREGRNRSRRSL